MCLFCQQSTWLNNLERGNVNWEIASIRLACEIIWEAIFCLMVERRGPSSLWAFPYLGPGHRLNLKFRLSKWCRIVRKRGCFIASALVLPPGLFLSSCLWLPFMRWCKLIEKINPSSSSYFWSWLFFFLWTESKRRQLSFRNLFKVHQYTSSKHEGLAKPNQCTQRKVLSNLSLQTLKQKNWAIYWLGL